MNERFAFALERLRPSDWEHFENLASEFLASEWPKIRTVASPSGDGGRDAELFSPEGDPSVVLQYSVAEDWKDKIKDTANKVAKNFPSCNLLVFVSPRVIGARADELKKEKCGRRINC